MQSGTIYRGTRFAGDPLDAGDIIYSKKTRKRLDEEFRKSKAFGDYTQVRVFDHREAPLVPEEFQMADSEATEQDAEAVAERTDASQRKR